MALDVYHQRDNLTAMRESINNLRGAGALSDKALKLVYDLPHSAVFSDFGRGVYIKKRCYKQDLLKSHRF
jgi:hypothetical protein